jgi:hypothetical protein
VVVEDVGGGCSGGGGFPATRDEAFSPGVDTDLGLHLVFTNERRTTACFDDADADMSGCNAPT